MTAIAPPLTTQPRPALTFATEWLNPSLVRITVAGDVDASNASRLADYVFRRAANCRRLILDLEGVAFFGTAGFTTLRTIDIRCERACVTWTLVSSPAVRRVLDICDPRHTLPVAAA
ncbi:MAG TPA: STAS domain-containing protein [Mycobacterium sp.]|nr:STAS domain-containing protein [Mycobacterium sp.]